MRIRALLLLLVFALPAQAGETVTVAVASNFTSTATRLADRFHRDTGYRVRVSSGSTGKLYSQIIHGAPFDVFLAADAERPRLLEQSGVAVAGSRFRYAIGSLVVYSARVDDCLAALQDPDAGHVAIANPATSPYGKAAKQYLEAARLWDAVSRRAVYGENIAQTLQFAATGNATVAIASRAQLQLVAAPRCTYAVPADKHDPIEQHAVLLDDGSESARAFLAFLQSEDGRRLIEQDGYETS